MEDVTCDECRALITPFGQTNGVFCPRPRCPGRGDGLVLESRDVTNICAENTFCLNFSGQRVEVKADTSPAPAPAALPKKRPKPRPTVDTPTLFDS